MSSRDFLIITWDRYPDGDAGAVRTHSFAKLLLEIGYTPIVVGMGESTEFNKMAYDGVDYYSLRYKNSNLLFRVLGRLFFLNKLKRIVKLYDEFAGVLLISADEKTFNFCKSFTIRKGIPLIYDAVEWYSPCEFKNGEKNRNYIVNDRINSKIIDKNFRVISISSYFNDYYLKKGIASVRIPVVLDVLNTDYNYKKSDNIVRIVYAGTIGTKDYINRFIEALEQFSIQQLKDIRFDIIGTSLASYENLFGSVKEELVNNVLIFHGRLPRTQVLSYLFNADFSVLIRPATERYAKAGFPTKICESFSTGTSVIANITSDLGMYLNTDNSIIVEDDTVNGCVNAINSLLNMSLSEIERLRYNSRKTAEVCFDWRNYVESLKGILNN